MKGTLVTTTKIRHALLMRFLELCQHVHVCGIQMTGLVIKLTPWSVRLTQPKLGTMEKRPWESEDGHCNADYITH